MVMIDEKALEEGVVKVIDIHGNERWRGADLTTMDKKLVPRTKRITVPLAHSRELRRIAEYMRVLANQLEKISCYTDVTEKDILIMAEKHIEECTKKIAGTTQRDD